MARSRAFLLLRSGKPDVDASGRRRPAGADRRGPHRPGGDRRRPRAGGEDDDDEQNILDPSYEELGTGPTR